MDGGRVFRALLAEHMKFTDATKYAAYIGRVFGIALAIFGFFYNIFLIVVGLFIYVGASEEAESTIVSTTIARVRVADVMNSEKGVAAPKTTVAEAVETMLQSRYHDVLVENEGVFIGVVTWEDIMKIKPGQRAAQIIGELPIKRVSISSDESVLEANKKMAREKIDLLPVIDKENPDKVVGVVTNESIANAIEKAKNLR